MSCCCFNLLAFVSLTSYFDADCAPHPKPKKIIKTWTVSFVELEPFVCLGVVGSCSRIEIKVSDLGPFHGWTDLKGLKSLWKMCLYYSFVEGIRIPLAQVIEVIQV